MRRKTLAGFNADFRGDPDPWRTFSDRDEALKRRAILRALGPGLRGRVLEVGAGNGSNSVELVRRSLRLDATDGSVEAVRLTARALGADPRAHAQLLELPAIPPRPVYDAVVVAEVLYYLRPADMAPTARRLAAALRRGGRLVLAHHGVDFHDFAQPARGVHARFLRASGCHWRVRAVRRTRRWSVLACTRR